MKHPTLSDVARAAGVSVSAASKALSNGGGATTKISAGTKARIVAVATALKYRPNEVARVMHHGCSKLVGLLFPSIAEPFYVEVLGHLHDLLAARGFLAVSSSWRTDSGFLSAYDAVMRYRPAGIISCHFECEYSRGTPTVLYSSEEYPGLDTVMFSDGSHRLEAVRYLAGLGHVRIGSLCSGQSTGAGAPSVLSMVTAIGLPAVPGWHRRCLNSYASAAAAAAELIALPPERRPTAVICFNDQAAIGFIGTCQSHGLRVPEDISVVGSDDLAVSRHLSPALTTFDLQAPEVAARLVELLFQRIQAPEEPVRTCRIQPIFAIRSSCAAPAIHPSKES